MRVKAVLVFVFVILGLNLCQRDSYANEVSGPDLDRIFLALTTLSEGNDNCEYSRLRL